MNIGAAEIDITPPSDYRMAGYFDERLATGTHDPLKAKAIILQQNEDTLKGGHREIALVFCDLVGLSLNVTTNVRAQASRLTGIPLSNIVICATHSHTGPLFDDVRRDYFHKAAMEKDGADPHEKIYYPAFLTEQLVKVIAQAQVNLRPAELAAGIAKQDGLTFNRRYWMKNGKVAFNPGQLNPNIVRPAGPSDSDVGILLARDKETKQPFAGVTVFAMHSDTVGGTEYSADYAFYLQQTLRGAFGENFISAFGAGTCGDLNHIDVTRKDSIKGFAVAERLGATLAQTVLNASTSLSHPISLSHRMGEGSRVRVPGSGEGRGEGCLHIIARPSLAVRCAKLDVPLQEVSEEQLVDARSNITRLADPNTDFFTKVVATKRLDLAQRGTTWPMEVQVFRLDSDTSLVCLPCEIFVELGLAIKQASPFKKTIVISICNDRPSYVPTLKAFSEGSYEVTNARVKPGAGEMLVDAAIALLRDLKP